MTVVTKCKLSTHCIVYFMYFTNGNGLFFSCLIFLISKEHPLPPRDPPHDIVRTPHPHPISLKQGVSKSMIELLSLHAKRILSLAHAFTAAPTHTFLFPRFQAAILLLYWCTHHISMQSIALSLMHDSAFTSFRFVHSTCMHIHFECQDSWNILNLHWYDGRRVIKVHVKHNIVCLYVCILCI